MKAEPRWTLRTHQGKSSMDRWRFSVNATTLSVTARSLWQGTRVTIEDDGTLLADQIFSNEGAHALAPESVSVVTEHGRLDVTVGSIGWWTVAC